MLTRLHCLNTGPKKKFFWDLKRTLLLISGSSLALCISHMKSQWIYQSNESLKSMANSAYCTWHSLILVIYENSPNDSVIISFLETGNVPHQTITWKQIRCSGLITQFTLQPSIEGNLSTNYCTIFNKTDCII